MALLGSRRTPRQCRGALEEAEGIESVPKETETHTNFGVVMHDQPTTTKTAELRMEPFTSGQDTTDVPGAFPLPQKDATEREHVRF